MSRATVPFPQHRQVLGITADIERAIFSDSAARAPQEACGALIGRVGTMIEVTAVYALPNRAAQTHVEYLIAASDVKRLEDAARTQGWSVIGFYHSHPGAAPVPSARDVECAWPGYVYVIAGTRAGAPCLSGWRLRDDRTDFDPVEVLCRL